MEVVTLKYMERLGEGVKIATRGVVSFSFDLTPMQHQMITNVFLPMAKRDLHGLRRHKMIKRLRDQRRRLEKKMIRSGNMSAAFRSPTRGTR